MPTSASGPASSGTRSSTWAARGKLRRVLHARYLRIVAGRIVAIGLRGIAVDERARVKRVRHAAHLVLDREQHLAAVGRDDVLKAVLILVALFGDQAFLEQPRVRPGKIR